MNKMLFIPLILGVILLGCDQSNPTQAATNQSSREGTSLNQAMPTHLLLFIDRSISLDNQAKVLSRQKLFDFLKQNYQRKGSVLQVQLIHANTLGVPPLLKAVQSDQDPIDLEKEPKIVQMRANQKLRTVLIRHTDSILTAIKAPFEPTLSQHTDIWASMEIISRFFTDQPNASVRKVVAYYSDMLESSNGSGRRDFNKFIPEDLDKIKALAVTDAQWIRKNYSLIEEGFQGIEVKIFATTFSEQSTKTQFVRYYWEALFAEFGIKEVQFYQ